MPVTFWTMMIGTLAIAGIPPLSGFFSKDEILLHAFGGNRILWVIAAVTAVLTAFYMMRLMVLTFHGPYRGPAWPGAASTAAAVEAAIHGARHPFDPHAHGQAQKPDHEVTHGAADAPGHGAWHGPHESPRTMTVPLVALAIGAAAAGVVGVPAALGGSNAIHRFLLPSFTASPGIITAEVAAVPAHGLDAGLAAGSLPHAAELGLMVLSVLLAVSGLLLARHFYLRRPELPARLAASWRGLYALLLNKYYADEIYDATVVRGTLAAGRGLWSFDTRVLDGAVDAWSALTRAAAWVSHMIDKHVVDGLVNFVGWSAGKSSGAVRRLHTGLIQNAALLMAAGVFVFLTIYLFAR
jgi:NADH:ubiquinone oxidoreductase subunit 5 (subunit L)/multisubunit Na+/H+ antiporter MnhA subunit